MKGLKRIAFVFGDVGLIMIGSTIVYGGLQVVRLALNEFNKDLAI